MSTLEVDSIVASTSNTDLSLDGAGTGVVNLATGAKLNGTALTSTFQAASANIPDVAPGTSGNLLTSNGSAWTSATPAAGGSWTRLQTISTASAASWDFETGINSTYDTYVLVWHTIPATDNALLYARVQVAAAYPTSGYEWSTFHLDTTSMAAGGSDSDGQFSMHSDRGQGNLATEGCAGQMMFHEPSSTTLYKMFHWTGYVVDTAANGFSTGGGGKYEGGTGAITGIKLYYSSGNIASGEATLYGIANS
jgi:hypothetical protein